MKTYIKKFKESKGYIKIRDFLDDKHESPIDIITLLNDRKIPIYLNLDAISFKIQIDIPENEMKGELKGLTYVMDFLKKFPICSLDNSSYDFGTKHEGHYELDYDILEKSTNELSLRFNYYKYKFKISDDLIRWIHSSNTSVLCSYMEVIRSDQAQKTLLYSNLKNETLLTEKSFYKINDQENRYIYKLIIPELKNVSILDFYVDKEEFIKRNEYENIEDPIVEHFTPKKGEVNELSRSYIMIQFLIDRIINKVSNKDIISSKSPDKIAVTKLGELLSQLECVKGFHGYSDETFVKTYYRAIEHKLLKSQDS